MPAINFHELPVDPSFSQPPRNGFARGTILAINYYALPERLRDVIADDDGFGNDRWMTWKYVKRYRDLDDPNVLAMDEWLAENVPGIPEQTTVFIRVC